MHDDTLSITLDSLLCYVNRRFHIVRDDIAVEEAEEHARSQLIERFLWEHRDLIADFVRENPDGLPASHLNVAEDLVGTIYGTLYLERVDGGTALILHETGTYSVALPNTMFFSKMPESPVELRGAIAPYRGGIIPIPPFAILGQASTSLLKHIHADLASHGADIPTADAQVLSRRSRAWRKRCENARRESRERYVDINALGRGYHRGVLAGLSDEDRARACREHQKREGLESGYYRNKIEALSIETDTFPVTLEEALLLLDTDWINDIALSLGDDPTPPALSRTEQVTWICEKLSQNRESIDTALLWCLDEQFALLDMLLDTNPLPLDSLDPIVTQHLYPMIPFVFILHENESIVAWMPPEVRSHISRDAFDAAKSMRQRLAEVHSCARALATMCGICSVSDVYERYRRSVKQPFDRRHFEMALEELETCEARDDYALWRHLGTDYVISVEIADESAPARVTRECYADHIVDDEASGLPESPIIVGLSVEDEGMFLERIERKEQELERVRCSLLELERNLPPHDIPQAMLQGTPIEVLMQRAPLRALRTFVDAHVPDDQDDYEFGDLFVRSIVVSSVLMAESYSDTMDIIRLYGMENCDGTGYSDTLGRLVTNAYNALPRWELNGWSLEENTERITGRRRFFNEDGTMRSIGDTELCPCGSGKTYGICCGHLTVA